MLLLIVQNNYSYNQTIDNKQTRFRERPTLAIKGITNYIEISPIDIFNDNEFEDYPFIEGEGTLTEPYIIDGYNITTDTQILIRIENTRKHFLINGCILDCQYTGHNAISLDNVTNGRIENNTLKNTNGIFLNYASNINIENNTILNSDYPIRLQYCNNTEILENIIDDCDAAVYAPPGSNYNIIKDNTISNAEVGFFFGSDGTYFINNTIYDCIEGIDILGGKNNTLINNTVYNCVGGPTSQSVFFDTAITLSYSANNNTLISNTVFNCSHYGISLNESSYNTLTGNMLYNISSSSLLQINSDYNLLADNTIHNCYEGIIQVNASHNILTGNIVYDIPDDLSIYLTGGHNNTYSSNTIDNCYYGIYLEPEESGVLARNCTIAGNTISNCTEEGIYLEDTNNIIVTGNTISNTIDGIVVGGSNDCTFLDNTIFNCSDDGIEMTSAHDHIFSNNTIYNGTQYGIEMLSSNGNSFTNNVFHDWYGGIYLWGSYFNNYTGNVIFNSTNVGIALAAAHNNTLWGNTIYDCTYGTTIAQSSNNSITYNNIFNNSLAFAIGSPPAENNTINWNNFVNNGVTAQAGDDEDNPDKNDVSFNYWDDWTSPDVLEPFGIVDDPYILLGSAVNTDPSPLVTPILPIINIQSPISQDYGTDTITVMLTGSPTIRHYRYYIEGVDSQNQTWFTGVIRTLPDGPYTLHAYGSDLLGHTVQDSVSFTIDAYLPTVTIASPVNTTYAHTDVPLTYTTSYETAMDIYLNGMVNTTAVPSGSVVSDFPGAPAIPDGSYNITIVVEDHAGNRVMDSIFFTIDTTPPNIIIVSPTATTYTTQTITLTLSSDDAVSYWYSIDDGSNQSWPDSVPALIPEGTHTIHAYGNDSVGNIGYASVTFTIEIPSETSVPVSSSVPTSTSATTPTTTTTPILETTPETSTTSSSEAASGTFPGIFTILVVFTALGVIIRRHKKL